MSFTRNEIYEMKEEEFQKKVLIPLFQSMQFRDVTSFGGGSLERGKDIVMWKESDFGQRLNYGVVVKAKKITGNAETSDGAINVLNQVRQMLKTTYNNPVNGDVERIKRCIVACSKEITKEAIYSIEGELKNDLDKLVEWIHPRTNLFQLLEKYLPGFIVDNEIAENRKPTKLSELEKKLEESGLDNNLKKCILQVCKSEQFPKLMSKGNELEENPVWKVGANKELLDEIVANYGFREGLLEPKFYHLDVFLIKCILNNVKFCLFNYYSKTWKAYLLPHRARLKKETADARLQSNIKNLRRIRAFSNRDIEVAPLDGKFLISAKIDPKTGHLVLHVFEFCSVIFSKELDLKPLLMKDEINKNRPTKKALCTVNQLRENSWSVNADVLTAIRDWYSVHLEDLPDSFPEGLFDLDWVDCDCSDPSIDESKT